jgi:HemK-related putative methylase
MPSKLGKFTIGAFELSLCLSDRVFQPTTTTQKIAEMVQVPQGGSVLDLGCGTGPLAIFAAKSGAGEVVAVDIMPEAVELARQNVQLNGVADKVTVLCGDLFKPVQGRRFDVIVNDVSGIAERVARISPWYPESIPTGGEDGTDVVLRVLEDASKYLNPGGSLYFAISSLSDTRKIIGHAKNVYGDRVELLGSYKFPFSPELTEQIHELEQLQNAGKISFETRRSRHLWTLDLLRAQPAF